MTLSEFKAWFEGYTEGLDGAPSEKQFKRIKAKVAEITGTPITQTIWIERYRDYWHQPMLFGGVTGGVCHSAGSVWQNAGNTALMNDPHCIDAVPWDSHGAMYAAGKAEALAA